MRRITLPMVGWFLLSVAICIWIADYFGLIQPGT